MSKLSELLNPAPVSGPSTPTPQHHQPLAIDEHDQDHHESPRPSDISPSRHASQSHLPPLNSPLDALAAAATSSAPAPSSPPPFQSKPVTSPYASPQGHHRTYSGPSSRPTTSYAPPALPFELSHSGERAHEQFSPGLEQYHHSSHGNTNRRPSDFATDASRELPPLRSHLSEESRPSAMALTCEQLHEENHTTVTESKSAQRDVDMEPPQSKQGIHEPDYLRHEPVTSQIRQPSPGPHQSPAPEVAAEVVPEQPEVKVESKEEPLESASIASRSDSYQPTTSLKTEATPATESVATPKTVADLKDESYRATSTDASTPSRSTSTASKPTPASKKRAAPKSSNKIDKKGTASTIKKPVAKKRRLESDSVDGTPASQRSGTPNSSRASKTPAPKNPKQNSATPVDGSPAPTADEANGDDDQDMDDDSELFCICRKPDDHTWMIGCDGGCEDWFHGRCVDMNERDGNLIDKYICMSRLP